MKGIFGRANVDNFRPEYGDIQWTPRLNNCLDALEEELQPVAYREGDKPPMQLTQENTMIFWNKFADELDAIALMYTPDNGQSTWYFREQMSELNVPEDIDMDGFDYVASVIGDWALQTITLYPIEVVVNRYTELYTPEIPDSIPADWS